MKKNDIKARVIICLCFCFDFRFVLDIYRAEGRTEDPRLVDEIPFHVPVVIECIYQVMLYFLILISQNWIGVS